MYKFIKKGNFGIIVFGVIVIFVIISSSASMFKKDINGENKNLAAGVALTRDNRSSTLSVDLDDMEPGSIKNYYFTVSNFENNDITSLKMNYTVQINKSSNLPIIIELYKNDTKMSSFSDTLILEDNVFDKNIKQSDSYQLVLKWDAQNTSYEYSNLFDYIDIIVDSKAFS